DIRRRHMKGDARLHGCPDFIVRATARSALNLTRFLSAVAIAAVLLLHVCIGVAAAQAVPVTVTVRVVADDLPVAGARVSTAGASALTDIGGAARLRLVPARHRVRVEKLGLAALEFELDVARDTVLTVRLHEE